jgi:hypothetical protein
MVERILLPVLVEALQQQQHHQQQQTLSSSSISNDNDNKNDTVVEIWDLGAGSGRDVCFLAGALKKEQGRTAAAAAAAAANTTTTTHNNNVRRTFCVVGLDQRYAARAADEECGTFWKRCGVDDCTASRKMHLEDWNAFEAALQAQACTNNVVVQCLFAVRFWNRPLVERLAQSPLLAKGTIFAISQFGKATPDATWDFAHPKVSHLMCVYDYIRYCNCCAVLCCRRSGE